MNSPDSYFAKSDKTTIRQHNDELLKNCTLLRESGYLNEQEDFWNLLNMAIEYHDYGKANKSFEAKISGKSNKEILFHHLISPLFFLDSEQNLDKITKFFIVNAIVSHHNRQYELIKSAGLFSCTSLEKSLIEIKDTLFKRFSNYQSLVNEYIDILGLQSRLFNTQENLRKGILTTGLLIRIDHASSAGLEVEEKPIRDDRVGLFKKYINGKSLRPFQEKFKDKDNACIVADTGLGKTGLSVLWSKRKMFYVLPNRSSTNAMYDILKDIYGNRRVGLLHSTSLYYMLDKSQAEDDEDISVVKDYEKTRILSKPVTVCTADQLFTAAFKYPTYEKIYATLAYSDVVIDEIQGFSPQQIVPILHQIKDTKELGTRYLIITATLPDKVAQEFHKIGVEVITDDKDTIDPVKRHKVQIESGKSIFELSGAIIAKFRQGKKVLAITNTVGAAQDLYKALQGLIKENERERLNLLHSRFIWNKRWEKEACIKEHCKQNENGDYLDGRGFIWVSTQLVEASLDIDFDYLFTEIAPIDSLVQRMGRIWRHRKSDYIGDPNIIVACVVDEKSVNFVYEKSLREKTIDLLNSILRKDDFLMSEQKRKIVKELYSEETLNLLKSRYLSEWKKIDDIMNSGWEFLINSESQRAFRDVLTIELIPWQYKEYVERAYEKLKNINSQLKGDKRKKQRANILRYIQKHKVPVPLYYVTHYAGKNNIARPYHVIDKQYEIAVLDKAFTYDEDLGLTKEIEEIDDFEERCV